MSSRRTNATLPLIGIATLLTLCVAAPGRAQLSNPVSSGGGNGGNSPSTSAPPSGNLPSTPVEVPDDYTLDTGDVVTIEVTRHGDVSRTMRIPADGKIRLPRLSQPFLLRGKTCTQVIEDITGKLVTEGKLVIRPGQVSVFVTEMRPRLLYVEGNAGKNGSFDLKTGWRVTELIAVIGAPPQPERVKAQLVNPKRPKPITLDLNAILNDPSRPENILLMEGDTLKLELPRNKRLMVKGEAPRGMHELDERFNLRQALVQLGFSTNGATGDLRHAVLYRHKTPGDPDSPTEKKTVDLYTVLTDDSAPDVELQDLDTLEVPVSTKFIYIYGEIGAPKKYYLPEDRPTYLVDIMSLGNTSGKAKIDDIKIWRVKDGKATVESYKFGKFLANGDAKQNPEIHAQDVIMVPDVKRADPVATVWTAWGLYNIMSVMIPSLRPPH